jgi:hypothetical protein
MAKQYVCVQWAAECACVHEITCRIDHLVPYCGTRTCTVLNGVLYSKQYVMYSRRSIK